MVKAILFDFWGTLVENGTHSPTREAQKIMRARMHYRQFIVAFEDSFFTKKWATQEEGFRNVFDRMLIRPHPIALEKLVGLWNKNKLLATMYPDTEEVLKTLKEKGYKLALLSNTDNFSVDFVLDKFKLRDYFDAIVFSYDVEMLKTNPKMFETALEKLGVAPEDAIMVGDSLETDIPGAKAAGVKGILVDRRGMREFEPKVAELKGILPLIEND
jgi:putative hydrolase of the HAD superfamily